MSDPVNLAAEALKAGRLVVIPTETVYGLGADATNDRAVAAIYAAKGRPKFNPLIVHVVALADAERLGVFNEPARKLAHAFWPGPLTIIMPRKPDCPVSLLASAGLPTIALRIPRHPLTQKLLRAFGRPIVAPSANVSGKISPTSTDHVRRSLGDQVAMILDGGPCEVGLESTIIGCAGHEPSLLRAGGVPREDAERVLGHPISMQNNAKSIAAPGQLESHYAPRAELRLNATAPRAGEAYLGFGSMDGPHNLSARGDLVEAAANLFRLLHELDATGAKTIAVAPIPVTGLGEAINDRLKRAAAPRQP
jgi:L-threonylcarbamoyladenylate synthase